MEITDIKIYKETDYSVFKKLLGNRDVKQERINAIVESIKKIGYQRVPILVNEKYEIIDGQGRVEACKALGLPIYFEIQEGIGIEECIAMNIKMKNWNIYDFVESYAAQGNSNYTKLQNYEKEYPNMSIIEIAMCLSESRSKNIERPLRDGTYQMIESEDTIGCLVFVNSVVENLKNIRGGSQQYIPILVGLYKFDLIDEERMEKAINTHIGTMKPAYNAEDALTELQNVYNYHIRHNEYFRDLYLSKMEKLGARYNK